MSHERRSPEQDRAAHNERLYREYLALVGYYGASESLTRNDGMPLDYMSNSARTVRASESCWHHPVYSLGHTVGVAPGTEDTATEPTVRIIRADGSESVETVASFRRSRTRRETTQQRETTPDVVRYNVGTADYLAGGDA